MLEKYFQNSVNEKYLFGNTFSTRWNSTTAQIILKDKGDIGALCPANSFPFATGRYQDTLSDKFWK